MLINNRIIFEDEACPVPDQVLGELYGADSHMLHEVIATVSPDRRAKLAMYCYRRAHLNSVGLAIAANCDEDDLALAGGNVGKMLFAISRQRPDEVEPSTQIGRRRVTLYIGPLKEIAPIMEAIDDAPIGA
jgi:hypothetical protein